ncbi:MAG: APC family permease [Elusimicrobia bacterium]|nr:APC family permease [Elusimicrobiota bacterium]
MVSQARKANLTQLAFMIYGAACAGAFGLEDMVSGAGPGAALITLIAMPFLFSLPVAWAVAELTTAFPVEGGNYRWSRMAFGDFWGFQAGWWSWMNGVVVNSMFAVLFADYLRAWWPAMGGLEHWAVCLALIWSMHYLNLRGVRAVGNSAIALSLILLTPFVILTVLGLAHWKCNPFSPMVPPGKSLGTGFGSAVVLGIWLYSGFDKLSAAAEEVAEPQRSFPRALLIAAVLTMASYLVPTLAALAANGDWKLWSGAYFPEAAAKLGGPGLKGLMVFGALCSNALLLNVTMLSASRMPLAMAQDGFLPEAVARPHPRYGTPALSLVAGSLVYSLFALLNFTQLAVVYAWFQMASYILLYANAWALRRQRPDAARPFKIPGGRWGLFTSLGLTCGLAALAIAGSVFKDGSFVPGQAAVGLLAMASGPLAFRVLRRGRAALTAASV